jgi:hypothetical protein
MASLFWVKVDPTKLEFPTSSLSLLPLQYRHPEIDIYGVVTLPTPQPWTAHPRELRWKKREEPNYYCWGGGVFDNVRVLCRGAPFELRPHLRPKLSLSFKPVLGSIKQNSPQPSDFSVSTTHVRTRRYFQEVKRTCGERKKRGHRHDSQIF